MARRTSWWQWPAIRQPGPATRASGRDRRRESGRRPATCKVDAALRRHAAGHVLRQEDDFGIAAHSPEFPCASCRRGCDCRSRRWFASTTICPLASPVLGSKTTLPLFSLKVPCTVCSTSPSVQSILVCAGSSVICTCCADGGNANKEELARQPAQPNQLPPIQDCFVSCTCPC